MSLDTPPQILNCKWAAVGILYGHKDLRVRNLISRELTQYHEYNAWPNSNNPMNPGVRITLEDMLVSKPHELRRKLNQKHFDLFTRGTKR